LKRAKEFAGIGHVEAHPVVAHEKSGRPVMRHFFSRAFVTDTAWLGRLVYDLNNDLPVVWARASRHASLISKDTFDREAYLR